MFVAPTLPKRSASKQPRRMAAQWAARTDCWRAARTIGWPASSPDLQTASEHRPKPPDFHCITNHELWNVQGSLVCEKFQACMFTFSLRLKIGNDRIRLCCEFRSCRKFYLDAYGIFVNWFYCYIKIVMKLTSGLFCSLQETIVSALSFYTSEFLFQRQKWGKCVGEVNYSFVKVSYSTSLMSYSASCK